MMKRLFLLLSLALSVCAAQSKPAAGNPAPPQDANAQKARQVAKDAITALGGEAYLKIFDFKEEGRRFAVRSGAGDVGVPYKRLYQYPDKEKFTNFKQGDWVVLDVGDKGYETTFRGTKERDPKELLEYNRRRQFYLDHILREWVSNKDTAFFYDGEAVANTKQVIKITMMNAENQPFELYVDSRSHLPIQSCWSWRDTDKTLMQDCESYDRYRLIQGVQTPFQITRSRNGQVFGEKFLTSITYNPGLGDTEFKVPEINYDRTKK
jgi:hypothetical protein